MGTQRKNIMLGTAGHVDHGKTALVKLLTGCDTDRLPAEKARGLTIELGFAPCSMRDGRIVGVVDVPGHVDFIRNMVAGAHGIDVAIFVVAADDGVMPQTREHLDILTLMGVRTGVIALTKTDLVGNETLQLVSEEVRGFVQGTFLADAPICPVSNVTGAGFDGFLEALDRAASACKERESGGLFRMWIERTFLIKGFGTVVSGIPGSGSVQVGDRLNVVPGGQVTRVRRLEVYGQEESVARAGECVAINLADAPGENLGRGIVLCQSDAVKPVSMVEAELRLVPSVKQELPDYAEVHLYVGTAEAMAKVAVLDGKAVLPGKPALVQLRMDCSLGVVPGERFVIRCGLAGLASGHVTTVGGGQILDTSDIRLRRQRPWTIESLNARRAALGDNRAWALLCLKQFGGAVTIDALAARAQMRPEHVAEHVRAAHADGMVLNAGGGTVVHKEVMLAAAGQIIQVLEKFHQDNPTRLGLEQSLLAEMVTGACGEQGRAERAVFDLAMAHLSAEGKVSQQGAVVVLAGWKTELSAEDAALCERISEVLKKAHLAPPSPTELAAMLNVPRQRLEVILRLLADRGEVVALDEKVIMHRHAIESAREIVIALFHKAPRFSTMEFRDALGVSRKFAVPLLDYFDKVRLTVRSGSNRTPGAEAKKALAGQ